MRIIGGKFKGRRFIPPAKNWPTRPTTDFAKEGLFNILNNRIDFEETVMLDLFGGTGSHCYEFISRGCKDVTYVDNFGSCAAFVTKISIELNIENLLTIYKSDVFRFLKTNIKQYDYIFAGPPYPLPNLNSIPDEIFKYNTLAADGLFVLEHNPNHDFKQHTRYIESRNYGTTIFSFFT
ncbi:MAG: RsmD family RNA methyltransferase [Saprospiraceae bacterium]|nr:RsmD family RNA methyltransferase [Saprospiraceae bacterium]